MSWLPALTALGCAVSLAGDHRGARWLRGLGKAVASGAFVAWAVVLGLPGLHGLGAAVTVALVLSTIGDLALVSDDKRWFLVGIVAFLLAHVAYAVGLAGLGPSPVGAAVAGAGLAAFGWRLWAWLSPHTGRLTRAVLAYVVVILTMVALAIGVAASAPDLPRVGLAIAAVVFAASDVLVARQRFVSPGFHNRLVGLPLYYAAQLLFVWSTARV